MVLMSRWFLTFCPIPSQFCISAYLVRLEDRTRLQMVVEVSISETTLCFADILGRVFQLLLGNGLSGEQAIQSFFLHDQIFSNRNCLGFHGVEHLLQGGMLIRRETESIG